MNKNNKKNGSRVLQGLLLATTAITGSTVIAATAAMAAGPTGGSVVVGKATITNPSATQTTITQSSKKALINWNSFSISKGSTVTFNQPNSKSLTVNRVTGPNASAIDGQLLANGSVWLINANGILFGKGSEINVGALIATTSDISDGDFKNGKYNFSTPSSNPDASVTNLGTITTSSGGSVVLSAPSVSNQGLIQANLGTVVLGGASAFTVDMTGDNLLRYQISAPVAQAPKDANGNPQSALVSNAGTIIANGGQVVMTARAAQSVQDDVINNTGMVQATSVSSHNGEIDLDAGTNGTVNASGTLDVSGTGTGQTGGTVTITGQNVNVADGAKINASGDTGGGTVEIGGGLHGQGAITNAQNTTVGNATITADAITKGNGGTVSVWSSGNASFNGAISSRGGAQGGNGGQVETSGQNLSVGDNATVDTTAPLGLTGDWLLDPDYITISSAGTSCAATNCTISPGDIKSSLVSTNVTLEANDDIQVLSNLTYTSNNTLSLISEGTIEVDGQIMGLANGAINIVAVGNIQIENNVSSKGGNIAVVASWNGTDTNLQDIGNSGFYGNGGGTVTIGGSGAASGLFVGSGNGSTSIYGYNIDVDAEQGNAQIGNSSDTFGNINVYATNEVSVKSGGADTTAQIGNGGSNAFGAVGGNISIQSGGDVLLEADGTGSNAIVGNVSESNTGSPTGNTGSQGGNITIVAGDPDTVHGLELHASGDGSNASIGNFALGATAGDAGDASGTINVTAYNGIEMLADSEDGGASAVIGNGSIYNSTTEGAITVNTDGIFLDANADNSQVRVGDTANGNVNFGAGGANTITINATSDNDYSGEVYAIAGGQSSTAVIGADSQSGDIAGDINIAADGDINVEAGGESSQARVGNSGINVNSNITVTAGSQIEIATDADADNSNATIGNFSNSGTVGGDIDVTSSTNIDLSALGEDSSAVIGNAGSLGQVSGSVTLIAQEMSGLGQSIENDVPNGDMTLEQIGNGEITLDGDAEYASDHDITVLAEGNIEVTGTLLNTDGTGAITLVAGWDGHTFDIADLTDPAKNAYGNMIPGGDARGSVIVGGVNADGDAEVGDARGPLTVEGYDVDVQAYYGNAQIGYSGGNSSAPGAITVNAVHDVNVTAADGDGYDDYDFESYHAQIGNGGDNSSENGGDIFVNAGNDVNVIADQTYDYYDEDENSDGYAQIGNGGYQSSNNSGSVNVVAGNNVNVTAGVEDIWYAQIGNGGDSSSDSTGAVNVTAGGDVNVTGEGDFAQIGNGGWGSSGDASGDVTVNVTGDLTLSAPNNPDEFEDSSDVYGYAQIGNGGETASDNASGTIKVTADNVELDGGFAPNLYAQIGNGAADGANEGDVSGNISVTATGDIAAYYGDAGVAWIGNNANTSDDYTQSGNVTLIGSDISLDQDNLAFDLGNGSPNDNGGDVFIGYTNGSGSGNATAFDGVTYDSANSLTLATTGDLIIDGDVQNSGAGDITLVGGWDGSTTDVPTIIANADSEYGNHNATVTIGGATDPAVGSKNGTTTIVSDNLTVDASNENAQLGYNDGANSAGGDIDIALTGALSLIGGTTTTAQIGNGDYGSNPGGDVTIAADSISNTANSDVTGDNVAIDITGSGNGIGTDIPLDVAVNNLAITTQGGDAYINSPNLGFNIGVESVGGVELNGGALYLSATGNITQSDSIDANSINVTTVSSGDITLTNADNTFGFATISSAGSASITDAVSLNIESAYVSDTLTLDVDGDITQGSGAISATTLIATATTTSSPATSGSITLDNSANTISYATLSASGDATLDDSSALEIDGATVGSGKTLALYDTASDGITQGDTSDDAIAATNLVATATSGPITLGNTSNSVSNATFSASGNVTLYDTAALTIQKAMLAGYTLTLTDTNAGGIGQASGASYGITAGAIDATATSGAIIFDSAYNRIGHATLSAATDATLYDASAVEIDSASVGSGKTLTLYDTGNGGITQGSGAGNAIIASHLVATTTASSNGGNIILDNTSNSVGTAAFTATGNVTLNDSIALTLNSASLAGYALTLNDSGGSITQGSGAITAASVNATTASSAAITLTNTGNSFGALTLSASGDGSIYDTAALTIDGASVGSSKTLTITDTNSGGIGQGAGSGNKITASNLVITDSSGAVTLNNMSNAIGTLVLTANGSSTVDDSVALKILGATVGASNALTLYETNGNITQGAATTNAINASVLNVTDTSGAVILDNANNVVGTLALSATGDSTFDDTTALQLNGINISGGHGITVHAGGNINESAGGSTAITAGSLIATTTSGAITLTNGSNAVGAASFTATGDVSFTDSIGFILNGASLAGQTLTLTDTGGDITQGSASSNAIAAHTLYLTDTSGGITLDNTHNSFSTVTLSANGDSTLYDTNSGGLYIQTADVGDSNLTLTATRGDITQNTAASYAITAGAVNATASNGSITLGNDSNQIGAVTFMAANDATLHDASAVEIDGATVGDSNTLTLYDTSEGGISQGGGDDDGISAPTLVATATNGGIILDNSGNSVSDATFTASGDVTLADTTGLTLNGASLSGYTLTLDDTGGDIDQGTDASDAIVASMLNAISTNGNVTLTNTGNTVNSASFTAGEDADFYDTSALEIDGASVDGTLTLTVAEGDITQGSDGSSGIMAGAVNATATSGAVTLDNDNNSIGAVTFSASTDATLHDASSVEIDGVSVGDANTFTIVDTGGNVTQGTGSDHAINAPTLSASATNGFLNLNNADNAVSDASLSSSGNSTLYDSQDLAITGISVGGNLTLLTTGNLTFESSAQLSDGDLLAVAGWDGTTTSRTSIIGNGAYGNNSGSVTIGGDNADDDVAVGSASGTTTLAGDTVTLDAENGYAQLGYHGAGGGDIYGYAKGDIVVQATDGSDYALIGNGTLGEDVSGNETGNIYLLAAGDIQLNTNGDSDEPATPWIGNSFGSSGVASGNLTIVAQDEEENCGTDDCDYGVGLMVLAALGSTSIPGSGGNVVVAFANPENNGSPVMTITDPFNYDSPHNLTVISGNSLYVDNSLQNAGSGNITLISGWNSGAVTGQNIIGAVQNNTAVSSLFSSKSSYGQTNNSDPNAGSIEIGCDAGDATCSSNTAAVGSASGTVTVFTNNLELTAGAGLGAQLGYIGAGSGAINVNAQGNVALTGGSVTGSYAQIGDGGYRIKGDTSDNITVNAGGIVQLEGGTVQESYAQIGNGGAESNSNSTGQYSDTGFVTVTGQSVVMQAGTGSASYVQIGNGGYKAGENLNGTATIGGPISGSISVTVSPPSNTAGVALTGGSADAYAQIGNGGDQVNYLWSGTGGTISGDITVKVSPAQSNSDAIQMVGGTSNNGYAQIGNGGNGENTPASGTSVGFNVSGSITVVDLKLWGGNGTNDYGQIGNGDNAGTGYGNVDGGIAIGGTDFNFKNGNGSGDAAGIGNNTGFGTITNNITGYPPPNTGPGAGAQGAISSTTQIPTIPTGFDITTVTITPGPGSSPSNDNGSGGTTPLEQIADGNGEGSQDSDSAADALGNSLNGHKVSSVTHIIIPGVLTQIVTLGSHNPNGVPPADADYSSWGNEALWRW